MPGIIFSTVDRNPEGILEAIKNGDDPNTRTPFDCTPLHLTVGKSPSFVKTAITLLKEGADPNLQDKNGDTPLHIACKSSCIEFMYLLLIAGASHTIKNKKGYTPIDILRKKLKRFHI